MRARNLKHTAEPGSTVSQSMRFKFLWELILKYKYVVLTSISVSILISICDIASIGLLVPLIDSLRNDGMQSDLLNKFGLAPISNYFAELTNLQKIQHVAVLMFLIQIIKSSLQYLNVRLGVKFHILIEKHLRLSVFDRLLTTKLQKLHSTSIATHFTLLNNYTGETGSLGQTILAMFPTIPTTILYITAMVAISWQLTLAGLFMAISATLVVGIANKSLIAIGRKYNKAAVYLNQIGYESLGAMILIRLFNRQSYSKKKFEDAVSSLQNQRYSRGKILALITPLYGVLMTFTLCVLFIAATFVFDKDNTEWVGSALIFMVILFRLKGPAGTFTSQRAQINSSIPSINGLIEFFQFNEKEPKQKSSLQFNSIKETITIDNLSFRYSEDDSFVLKNLNFEIPKNKMTAIVGASGGGKSSFINLFTGLYLPTKGSIKIDGIDLKDFDNSSWQNKIGVVSQNPFLFNDTIISNVQFGKLSATEDEIISACKQSNAHEFIEEFPEKYNTIVGDQGHRLSGGQAQRIAIARAIIGNPEILVLDEATSSLDAESETIVQKAIDAIGQNRTVLCIAHRFSTIKSASNIIVLEQGNIVESGTYKHLIGLKKHFYNYVELQKLD
tara:strand:+ start:7744 stop:9588 length:1845 start_codon:yes stop_codon:yes gene_type:complete